MKRRASFSEGRASRWQVHPSLSPFAFEPYTPGTGKHRWSGAINGVFRTGTRLPALPVAIFLPVIFGAPLLLLSNRVGQVLDAMPASWLVALRVYRVFGSWGLVAGLRGALPGVFACRRELAIR